MKSYDIIIKFQMISAMRKVKEGKMIENDGKGSDYFRLGIMEGLQEKLAFEQRSRDEEETAMKRSQGVPGRGR